GVPRSQRWPGRDRRRAVGDRAVHRAADAAGRVAPGPDGLRAAGPRTTRAPARGHPAADRPRPPGRAARPRLDRRRAGRHRAAGRRRGRRRHDRSHRHPAYGAAAPGPMGGATMSTSGGHDAVEDPTTQGGGRQRTPWPVWAWALWDWGSAAFNAVITTFVFSVYITDPDIFGDDASSKLGWALAGAGVLIAVLAPVLGQGADRAGRRTFWLAIKTYLVGLTTAGLRFVRPEAQYLWLGLVLLAVGNVFFEIASVNYNAMLNTISTKDNVGRISGLGWGLGYLGGIVLLTIVVVGFVNPDSWFGIENDDALGVRLAMLLCAVWTLVFSLPVIRTIRDDPAARGRREPGAGVVGAYRLLFASIARLWRTDRTTVYFLAASAVFRDGLAGVFTFGAVIAARAFDFSDSLVIVFAIVANVVAGIATIAAGRLDD